MTGSEAELLAELASEEPARRYRAISRLAACGGEVTIEPLIQVLLHDEGLHIEPVNPACDYSSVLGPITLSLKASALWALREIYARRGPFTPEIDDYLNGLAPEVSARARWHAHLPDQTLLSLFGDPELGRKAMVEAICRGLAGPAELSPFLPRLPGTDKIQFAELGTLVQDAFIQGLRAQGVLRLLAFSPGAYGGYEDLGAYFLQRLHFCAWPDSRRGRPGWRLEDLDAIMAAVAALRDLDGLPETARAELPAVLSQLEALRPRFNQPDGLEQEGLRLIT